MAENLEIDNVDMKILALLTEDAQMPYTEIAKRVYVSSGTVHVRMKKMEKMGVVRGSALKVDFTKLGFDITAFLGLYLEKSSLYHPVAAELKKIPEIVSIHYTTGQYSLFLKIVCKNTVHLREVLSEKVQKIKGIERTETFISLEESLERQISLR
ncbi:Lrp/AsnC ligand binding domain-containing protein [Cytophagales bacterium LB-30]|uniref:Lrp/AsnC ligand binding domain-containing protein n=1 Tax=Shiella aurantiaca TaxID=3058365 RepID=A0ABT8F4B7_9BACT|nr:Lrp/AsnC ligand binding domain-containing protein [Shiella aurantiaca]MDN4165300.1 Lrp/AsnC ligand binding domain-containing protein [Shiella aurantiaca]